MAIGLPGLASALFPGVAAPVLKAGQQRGAGQAAALSLPFVGPTVGKLAELGGLPQQGTPDASGALSQALAPLSAPRAPIASPLQQLLAQMMQGGGTRA